MKFLIVLLCALAATNAVLDSTFGIRISSRAAATCTAADQGFKCSDCSGGIICTGAIQLGEGQPCAASVPFCDKTANSCTASKPTDCEGTGTSEFACPEEGFFPNPNSCKAYYFCDSAKKAEQWECPVNYVYNALLGYCKRQVSATECVTIKCTANMADPMVVHKGNPNFYAYCDSTQKAHLFKCPLNQQYSNGCRYVCKAEGYFAGKTKTQRYHCARSGVTFVQTIEDCPTGYELNASVVCVKAATPATGTTT